MVSFSAAAGHGDALTDARFHLVGQRLADQDHILIVILQEATGDDVLGDQADRCLHRRLNGRDGDRVGLAACVDHAAGVDALGCQQHLRMCGGNLHDLVDVLHRQQRQPAGFGAVAGGVDLHVAAVKAHCIAVGGLGDISIQAIGKDQQHQSNHNRDQRDDGAARVAPNVAPSQFEICEHAFQPSNGSSDNKRHVGQFFRGGP